MTHPNNTKRTPWHIAAEYAANAMRVDETGIKVDFLGIHEIAPKGLNLDDITPTGPFSVILHREGAFNRP